MILIHCLNALELVKNLFADGVLTVDQTIIFHELFCFKYGLQDSVTNVINKVNLVLGDWFLFFLLDYENSLLETIEHVFVLFEL